MWREGPCERGPSPTCIFDRVSWSRASPRRVKRGMINMTPWFQLRCVLIAGAGAGAGVWGEAHAQVLSVVEPAPGFVFSDANYVAPGGTVVGRSWNGNVATSRATRWASVGAPAEVLGAPSNGWTSPLRCSDDGQVVVGAWRDTGVTTPAMWGPSGEYVALPGRGSVGLANGVSADGSVVTGWHSSMAGRWMQRWVEGRLTQQYGPSFVSGPCSPDGNTALGVSTVGGSAASALARWSIQGGPHGSVETMAPFPQGWTSINPPVAMTPTADAAIGIAYTVNDAYQLWIWRNGEITDMGLPEGMTHMLAGDISADGNLVVGLGNEEDGPTSAQVWTPEAGWESMENWLALQGISFPGWSFRELHDVSPDGRTFAGLGFSPEGLYRGFVVTIPGPGATAALAFGLGVLARRRR